jgi:hypothetical protein
MEFYIFFKKNIQRSLQRAFLNDCCIDPYHRHPKIAAEVGHLSCLKRAKKAGYKLNKVANIAVKYEQFHILKWLRENNFYFSESAS